MFPDAPYYDLLLAAEFRRLSSRPGLLAEECAALGWRGDDQPHPIIVDEVQKLPELLDEVHSLMSRWDLHFILTGSSPRKLLRGGGNLLGGRAVRLEMLPLTSAEIPDLKLETALNHGLLPRNYLAKDAGRMLEAYVGDYLREEVLAEALTRNLPVFQRFLEAAAFSNGQIVNFTSISRDIGVAANTVRGYFEVLVDTLIATWLPAWTKRAKRRVIGSPRFYFFDIGIVNELAHRGIMLSGSKEYGAAFEHFIFMELRAAQKYLHGPPLAYWRTASGIEVDFIVGDGRLAIEAKSSESINQDHLKGLRAWHEEHPGSRRIVVCRAQRPRLTEDGIEILPWRNFCEALWQGELFSDAGSD